jgi:hypothetical protein
MIILSLHTSASRSTICRTQIQSLKHGVVHKVNPRERLHTPCTAGYQFEDEQADDVYQEEELPTTFTIDEGVALNSLVGDRNDVTADECVASKRKRNPRNQKATLRALDRRRLLDRDSDEF